MKLLLLAAAGSVLLAQQPRISNANVETRSFSGSLESTLQAVEPTWFAYAVKTMPGDHKGCCYDDYRQRACSLEDRDGGAHVIASSSTAPIPLEDSDTVVALFRVMDNKITRIRMFSLSCPLDGGKRKFVWLTGVPAETSLTYLEKLIRARNLAEDTADGALMLVAQHDTDRADGILDRVARSDESIKLREQAIFWMGAARGSRSFDNLRKILARDENEKIRDKAIFAISISHQPQSISLLIDTAKHDSSPHVRGQAIFWLAQKAGAQATATIRDAVDDDPDTQVKKQAVFALSQLPKEDGVPKLIEIAKTQKNSEVRKQAMFWLGQSGDPRALALFEQILLKLQ